MFADIDWCVKLGGEPWIRDAMGHGEGQLCCRLEKHHQHYWLVHRGRTSQRCVRVFVLVFVCLCVFVHVFVHVCVCAAILGVCLGSWLVR